MKLDFNWTNVAKENGWFLPFLVVVIDRDANEVGVGWLSWMIVVERTKE